MTREGLRNPCHSDWRRADLAGTIRCMDQITLGLEPLSNKTCKEVFLDAMNQVSSGSR